MTGREITVSFSQPTALQIDGETIPYVSSYCVHSGRQNIFKIPDMDEEEKQMVAAM